MKKKLYKLMAICGYMFVLLCVIQFDFIRLFHLRDILLVVAGTIILTLPYLPGMKKNHIGRIIGWNAMVSSYIATFILVFARLSSGAGMNNLLGDIAVCCCPIFYGFIILVLFQEDSHTAAEEEKTAGIQEQEQCIAENEQQPSPADNLYRQGLTQREIEIALLAARGCSNCEIANELCIAESTVKKHMSHIFEKLQIESRNQILRNTKLT